MHVIDPLHDNLKADDLISVLHLTVLSLKHKTIPMTDYVVSQGSDVLLFTETLLATDTDQLNINKLVVPGYELNHRPSKGGRRDRYILIPYKCRYMHILKTWSLS